MIGVIIAGGAGTRLRPLTYLRSKPMMPIAGKPLLQYQVELLRKHGVTQIVFCVSGDVDSIKEYFGSGEVFGVRIDYSIESSPLGTAGAVRYSEPCWQDDVAIVLNGDAIMDHDLSAMASFHLEKGAASTIGLVEVPKPTPCGTVTIDADDRVTSFVEPDQQTKCMLSAKQVHAEGTATVNGGVYIVSRSAIQRLPYGENSSIERDFFPSLIEDGYGVYGYPMQGYWIDIGSPSSYLQAHHDLLVGKIEAVVPGTKTPQGYWRDSGSQIDPSAHISPNVYIGTDTVIGANVKVEGFGSIGSGCHIGEDCVLDGCIILENVTLANTCALRKCIIDRDSNIGNRIKLGDGSVVAAGSILFEA